MFHKNSPLHFFVTVVVDELTLTDRASKRKRLLEVWYGGTEVVSRFWFGTSYTIEERKRTIKSFVKKKEGKAVVFYFSSL